MNDLSITSISEPRRLRHIIWMLCISLGYLLLSYVLIGFHPEQVFLLAVINLCYFISAPTRKFITAFSIFIIYWVIFDYMKAFPNYLTGQVHIESLYNFEKSLFGIHYNGQLLTPNEYLLQVPNSFFNVITGLFYLCWIPLPLAFGTYLFVKNREQFFHFSLTFFVVNLVGFVVYYSFPAAPPWYVQEHGFVFNAHTSGSAAGLVRFDDFFNINVFRGLYEKSSNVFAAMPSLHSSYPLIVLYYGLKNRLGKVNILFATICLGIWFAAVYSQHHYVLDVLAGIVCAVAGITLYNSLIKIKMLKTSLNKMVTYVS